MGAPPRRMICKSSSSDKPTDHRSLLIEIVRNLARKMLTATAGKEHRLRRTFRRTSPTRTATVWWSAPATTRRVRG